jgi:uncharacterized protein (DUF58 family)
MVDFSRLFGLNSSDSITGKAAIPRDDASRLALLQRLLAQSHFLSKDAFVGNFISTFRGSGLSFEEFRDYVPGDDLRRMDWKASARRNRPLVRVYKEERERTILFLLDVSGSMFWGSGSQTKWHALTEIFSLLAQASIRAGDRVGAVWVSDKIEATVRPQKGAAQSYRLLHRHAHLQPVGQQSSLSAGIQALLAMRARSALCFILSDFWDAAYENVLRVLAMQNHVFALTIHDPAESRFPLSGMQALVDSETSDRRFVFVNDQLRKHLKSEYEKRQKNQKQLWGNLGIVDAEIDCHKDVLPQCLNFFRKVASSPRRTPGSL